MRIRKATVDDYEALCAVIQEADALHCEHLPHIFQPCPGPARDRNYIVGLIEDPMAMLWVAEHQGQLVGFINVTVRDAADIPLLVPRRYAFVENIVVKESFQRRGVGEALMARAHRWAEAQGARTMELNVYEFNQAAQAFYRKLGYETLTRRMRRRLG
jgi:ribosomal protein S18 acetylase RimI-like enzyme